MFKGKGGKAYQTVLEKIIGRRCDVFQMTSSISVGNS